MEVSDFSDVKHSSLVKFLTINSLPLFQTRHCNHHVPSTVFSPHVSPLMSPPPALTNEEAKGFELMFVIFMPHYTSSAHCLEASAVNWCSDTNAHWYPEATHTHTLTNRLVPTVQTQIMLNISLSGFNAVNAVLDNGCKVLEYFLFLLLQTSTYITI